MDLGISITSHTHTHAYHTHCTHAHAQYITTFTCARSQTHYTRTSYTHNTYHTCIYMCTHHSFWATRQVKNISKTKTIQPSSLVSDFCRAAGNPHMKTLSKPAWQRNSARHMPVLPHWTTGLVGSTPAPRGHCSPTQHTQTHTLHPEPPGLLVTSWPGTRMTV